MFRMV